MNINLSSVSESPKAAKVVSESVDTDGEVTESGGFFSKLTSLIKGETSEDAKSAESVKGAEATSDSKVAKSDEVDTDEIKASSTKAQSTDDLLASEQLGDESADGDTSSAKAVKGEDADDSTISPDSKTVVETGVKGAVAADSSAEKIVSDNDQVLQRLDEANKALQPKDGKPLPQSEQDALVTDTTIGKENASIAAKSESEKSPLNADTVEGEMIDGEGKVVIPESAQRFVQQSSDEPQTELTHSKDAAQLATGAAAASKTVSDEAVEQVASEASLAESAAKTDSVSSAAVISPDEETLVSASKGEMVDIESGDAVGTVAGVSALSAGVLAAAGAAEVSGKVLDGESEDTATQGVSSTTGQTATQSEEQLDPTVAAASTVAASAIPWANSEVSAEELAAQDVKIKAQAQQAPVAQSVQQALAVQQGQSQLTQNSAQVLNTHTSLPPELAMNQLQAAAVAPNVAMTQDQAVLKAALGANAAAGIGKLTKNSDVNSAQGESSFAQQIAQASGQQAGTSFNQIRPEQAAAQAPLQLNREMAGDQVAERVQMMMSKNLKNIDIRLDPPELGRLQIRMNMNGDGATVHFTVANQQARDIIEQSMPRLREMLAQQGLQLGDTSVQQQSSGQQQSRYAANGDGQSGQGNGNQALSGEENLEPDVNLDLNVASKRDGISYYA